MREEEKLAMDKRKERMVSTLLKDFVCLEYGEYIIEEFRLILHYTEKEMERLFTRAKTVMDVLLGMVPEKDLLRQVSLQLLRHFFE
jgi:hypothetical protein